MVVKFPILTEQGDIMYASAAYTPAALHHGNAGEVLTSGGHGADPSWAAAPGGGGDVTGPAGAVDHNLPMFDGATGKLLEDSGVSSATFTQKATLTEQGDIYYASAASTPAALAHGNAGEVLTTGGHGANPSWVDPLLSIVDGPFRNSLINGSFQVNQQAVTQYTSATAPANTDDSYAAPDLWYILSDGNDIIDVYPESAVIPTGGQAAVKLEVETANKKFGIAQIIPNDVALTLSGQYVSLQFKARTTALAVANLRAVVLSWTGAADTVTSDLVNAWGAAGDNVTAVANYTIENVAANLALTNAYQTFKVENIYIDTAGVTNVVVFIHVDDTDCSVNDLVYISDVQLNVGSRCMPYFYKRFKDVLEECKYFWQKSYAYATALGAGTEAGVWESATAGGASTIGNIPHTTCVHSRMRTTATPSVYDTAGTVSKVSFRLASGALTLNIAPTVANVTEHSFQVEATLTATTQRGMAFNWVKDCRL